MHVAVIMPVRDMADLIDRAIIHVLAQSYNDISLWVVDDDSQDNSADVVDHIIRSDLTSDRQITLCGAGGNGPGSARNVALREVLAKASPSFFLFADADDVLRTDAVATMVRRFEEDPAADLVYADEDYVDKLAGVAFRRYRPPFTPQAVIAGQAAGGSYMVRRRTIDKFGLFDETMRVGEMHEYAARIAAESSCSHIPQPLIRVTLDYRALRHTAAPSDWEAAYKTVLRRAGVA